MRKQEVTITDAKGHLFKKRKKLFVLRRRRTWSQGGGLESHIDHTVRSHRRLLRANRRAAVSRNACATQSGAEQLKVCVSGSDAANILKRRTSWCAYRLGEESMGENSKTQSARGIDKSARWPPANPNSF
jgi:hypothetical protein